jgi:hypothetical protein
VTRSVQPRKTCQTAVASYEGRSTLLEMLETGNEPLKTSAGPTGARPIKRIKLHDD